MPERLRIAVVPATIAARLTIWAVGVYAVWQGLDIINGGPERFGSASFAILRLAPNPTLFWGFWLSTAGVAVLWGSIARNWWIKAAGLIGVAAWSIVFAIGAFKAVAASPIAATTGGKTYALIAFAAVVLIFIDERRRGADVGR